jgi:hypothetical protein
MLDYAIGKAVKVIHEALEDNVSSVRFYSIKFSARKWRNHFEPNSQRNITRHGTAWSAGISQAMSLT